jgi:hypothetical protein
VLRLTARDEYEYAARGKTQELLAKAEAAARALGVPCESRQVVSDKPAQAIVAAAPEGGCDLIFMASHGRHGKLGMALLSAMLEVLMNARLPVLISSIGEPALPARAIGIIATSTARSRRSCMPGCMRSPRRAVATPAPIRR